MTNVNISRDHDLMHPIINTNLIKVQIKLYLTNLSKDVYPSLQFQKSSIQPHLFIF